MTTLTDHSLESIEQDPVHQAAADWFTRLRDPEVSLEEVLEWQRWVRADIQHATAFARIEEAWDALQDVPVERVTEPSGEKLNLARRRTWWYAAAASVATVAVAVSWNLGATSSPTQRIHTPVGENLTLKLEDGSQVTLGGDSVLEVDYSHSARNLRLSRGEAFFAVSKDPKRPFRVEAGKATVIALGTEFNVRRSLDQVEVAVLEGRVRLEPSPSPVMAPLAWLRDVTPLIRNIAPSLDTTELDAGAQALANKSGIDSPAPLSNPDAVVAWREGLLPFRGEPLRYAIEHVNRYSTKPILIDDERIGDFRITGTVVEGNVSEWIKSLESAFDLEAREEDERIVLRGRG